MVLASLVMHYLPDWTSTLREFHRVLLPRGRLIISTHHPFMDHTLSGGDDYFAIYSFGEEWCMGEHPLAHPRAGAFDALARPGVDPLMERRQPRT